jgi:hypothetical protein
MAMEDAMERHLPAMADRRSVADRRALAHLVHGLSFLSVTAASLPDAVRAALLACVNRHAPALRRSPADVYGVLAGLSGIGVTKHDLSEEAAACLYDAAAPLLAAPAQHHYIEKFVTAVFGADDCAAAMRRVQKLTSDPRPRPTSSVDEHIYL